MKIAGRRWVVRNALAVALVVGLLTSGFVLVGTSVGRADSKPLPGVPVAVADQVVLATAGGSCPALGMAKLSGQIMAESGFDQDGVGRGGGQGLARLTDAEWDAWKPSQTATRTDRAANILALAHLMCDLVGQLRVLKVPGDPWQLSLAAFHSGLPAVNRDRGIPEAARDYVERVIRHASWYALSPDGSGLPQPSPSLTLVLPATTQPSPTPTRALPTPSAAPAPTAKPSTPARTSPTRSVTPAKASPSPTKRTTPGLGSGGGLYNDEFHACLSANRALDGTHLIMARCDASAPQRWRAMSDGTIRSVGLCMDAANASTANWTPVQVAVCSGNPAQQFKLNSDGHIYSSYADKCVNIHYDSTRKTTSVVLFTCLKQTNQLFRVRQQ